MAIVNVPETLVNLHPSEGLAAIIPRSPFSKSVFSFFRLFFHGQFLLFKSNIFSDSKTYSPLHIASDRLWEGKPSGTLIVRCVEMHNGDEGNGRALRYFLYWVYTVDSRVG